MAKSKTQINLYTDADMGQRMDKLIEAYNRDKLVGKIRSRGELLEILIGMLEAHYAANDEVTSFFECPK